MPTPSPANALDHVVVVMFENRSFDNLLGRLYEPGEVESFEGVIGKELSTGAGLGKAPAAGRERLLRGGGEHEHAESRFG